MRQGSQQTLSCAKQYMVSLNFISLIKESLDGSERGE